MIESATIVVPPLPRQVKFDQRQRATEAASKLTELALAELDTLFASLQQRAFRGEL